MPAIRACLQLKVLELKAQVKPPTKPNKGNEQKEMNLKIKSVKQKVGLEQA